MGAALTAHWNPKHIAEHLTYAALDSWAAACVLGDPGEWDGLHALLSAQTHDYRTCGTADEVWSRVHENTGKTRAWFCRQGRDHILRHEAHLHILPAWDTFLEKTGMDWELLVASNGGTGWWSVPWHSTPRRADTWQQLLGVLGVGCTSAFSVKVDWPRVVLAVKDNPPVTLLAVP